LGKVESTSGNNRATQTFLEDLEGSINYTFGNNFSSCRHLVIIKKECWISYLSGSMYKRKISFSLGYLILLSRNLFVKWLLKNSMEGPSRPAPSTLVTKTRVESEVNLNEGEIVVLHFYSESKYTRKDQSKCRNMSQGSREQNVVELLEV